MRCQRFVSLLPLFLAVLILLTACGPSGKRPNKNPSANTGKIPHQTASTTEAGVPEETAYDPNLYVVIRSAEDLMAFNRAVNRDEYDFSHMTVVFLSDVDMADYTWTPLDGRRLIGTTFDGQGHTLKNLRLADHEYPSHAQPDIHDKGCGLVDVAEGDLLFRDLTLERARVKAYDLAVGSFVGSIKHGFVRFENCHTDDFTVEGWMDWYNRDVEQGGHAIALRIGGFIGYVGEDGRASFSDCSAENLSLSGFHNLAGFVGYDGSGFLGASAFSNCCVTGAEITFSYLLSEAFTAEQELKFVSVFFNSSDHADNIDACLAAGNHFENVRYYDWANDYAVYTPNNFRSPARGT
ncbi:MAG: hypothetical protein E7610_08850 [Ruminococcaceae bacterium]|nr:hypothetical protein [Oscillospiraceae bacterium]